MSEDYVTKSDFNDFKKHLYRKLDAFMSKFDTIFDPKEGLFADMIKLTAATERAHERIDEQGESVAKLLRQIDGVNGAKGIADRLTDLEEHRDKAVRLALWIGGGIGGPILAGMGWLIFKSVTGS